MKKKTLTIIFIVFTVFCYSQDKKEGNKIFFVDFFVGGSTYSNGNVNSGLSINFQNNKDLFTFRTSNSKKLQDNATVIFWLLPFSFSATPKNSQEYSFLYGKRFIKNDFSYSTSIGVSLIKHNTIDPIFQEIGSSESTLGIPLEFNLRWFRGDKKANKLLGLIPISKETGFGASSGLKLFATISKKSYVGLALNFGFGYYKDYK
ncbi:hypothetical protein [Polaribacter uvawellassae]|uniref:hypothetical protein n=1 Tax=Polaribacter uvawellassae TaxID=3133495 RepID=UPI003219C4FE